MHIHSPIWNVTWLPPSHPPRQTHLKTSPDHTVTQGMKPSTRAPPRSLNPRKRGPSSRDAVPRRPHQFPRQLLLVKQPADVHWPGQPAWVSFPLQTLLLPRSFSPDRSAFSQERDAAEIVPFIRSVHPQSCCLSRRPHPRMSTQIGAAQRHSRHFLPFLLLLLFVEAVVVLVVARNGHSIKGAKGSQGGRSDGARWHACGV